MNLKPLKHFSYLNKSRKLILQGPSPSMYKNPSGHIPAHRFHHSLQKMLVSISSCVIPNEQKQQYIQNYTKMANTPYNTTEGQTRKQGTGSTWAQRRLVDKFDPFMASY